MNTQGIDPKIIAARPSQQSVQLHQARAWQKFIAPYYLAKISMTELIYINLLANYD